jgi:hypothetical protein
MSGFLALKIVFVFGIATLIGETFSPGREKVQRQLRRRDLMPAGPAKVSQRTETASSMP